MADENVPCNLDIERLILGSAMISAAAIDNLRGTVEPGDFHLEKHKRIWAAVRVLYDGGARVDYVVVAEELGRRGQLASVDGISYLVSMTEGLPMLPSLDEYTGILREKATLRQLMLLADSILKRCAAGMDTAEEITNTLAAALLDLNANSASDKRAISTREMIDEHGIDELLKPRRTEGIRLPWSRLNGALCGLHPGQMIVMAADTGRGKTSFALQVATHVTRQNKSPIIWTLEMSPRQMFRRMVNQMAHVDADRDRHGMLTSGEVTKRMDAAYWLHGHPVWFDRHSRTVPSFCASVRQAKAKSDVGLAVVDYLQLIGSAGRRESRTREVGENSRSLKLAAMDLDLPMLVLSQFRRLGDQEASIHSLKESGDIENDSDVVLLMNAPALDGDDPVPVNIKIGKQREGPAGWDIPLMFHPPSQSFSPPESEAA